jgi:hypothetical protein
MASRGFDGKEYQEIAREPIYENDPLQKQSDKII